MRVAIIMGSPSDKDVMAAAEEYLDYFGIGFDVFVMSAHRTPEQTAEFARGAQEKGYSAVIAGAGMAAHLPGVIAAYTTLPVIGVPLGGSALQGVDALYAIVQMPAGVPVATMAIGKAGARNIGALTDTELANKLTAFRKNGCKL